MGQVATEVTQLGIASPAQAAKSQQEISDSTSR